MRTNSTPVLDLIAAQGNRGHHGWIGNHIIICQDGTTFSAIAGGGTYSEPRPPICTTIDGQHEVGGDLHTNAPCDYPGPYSSIEVYTADPELLEFAEHDPDEGAQAFSMEVALLKSFVLMKGGEFCPIEDAEQFLRENRQSANNNPSDDPPQE